MALIDFTAVASAGLVQLALFGSPAGLLTEYPDGESISARAEIQTAGFLYDCQLTGRMGNTGRAYTGRGITDGNVRHQNTGTRELLAPSGFRLTSGGVTMELAMVEPYWTSFGCSWDHFIVEYSNGRVERWDVGRDEFLDSGGDGIPYLLEENGIPVPIPAVPPGDEDDDDDSGGGDENGDGGSGDPGDGGGNAENNNGNAASGGGGGSSGGGAIIGGFAVAGFLLYSVSGGTADELSWTPQYAFRYNNGKPFYSYGSRWEYAKDNWSVYWTAEKTRGGENWFYGSGAKWAGDAWTASFGGESFGGVADAVLSLAARRTFGGWVLQSGAHSSVRMDDFGAHFSHRLTVAAALRRNRWDIDFSAAVTPQDNNFFAPANARITLKRNF